MTNMRLRRPSGRYAINTVSPYSAVLELDVHAEYIVVTWLSVSCSGWSAVLLKNGFGKKYLSGQTIKHNV